jgi:hypothetical protein
MAVRMADQAHRRADRVEAALQGAAVSSRRLLSPIGHRQSGPTDGNQYRRRDGQPPRQHRLQGGHHRPPCRGNRHRDKLAGYEPPTSQEAVKAVMRGIGRTIGAAAHKSRATADIITSMLTLCPPTLAGARDRALLALGFAGASVGPNW